MPGSSVAKQLLLAETSPAAGSSKGESPPPIVLHFLEPSAYWCVVYVARAGGCGSTNGRLTGSHFPDATPVNAASRHGVAWRSVWCPRRRIGASHDRAIRRGEASSLSLAMGLTTILTTGFGFVHRNSP